MKLPRFARSSFVTGSTLLLAIVVATGAVGFGQGSVEKMLLDLEAQWEKASEASDGKMVEPLLAPSFVFYEPDGTMQTKAEFVADVYKFKWQDTTGTDMKVTVTGDSAIVSGIWTGKGTDPKGQAFSGKQRFVDTWVKMSDGKWRCVAAANIPLK